MPSPSAEQAPSEPEEAGCAKPNPSQGRVPHPFIVPLWEASWLQTPAFLVRQESSSVTCHTPSRGPIPPTLVGHTGSHPKGQDTAAWSPQLCSRGTLPSLGQNTPEPPLVRRYGKVRKGDPPSRHPAELELGTNRSSWSSTQRDQSFSSRQTSDQSSQSFRPGGDGPHPAPSVDTMSG